MYHLLILASIQGTYLSRYSLIISQNIGITGMGTQTLFMDIATANPETTTRTEPLTF